MEWLALLLIVAALVHLWRRGRAHRLGRTAEGMGHPPLRRPAPTDPSVSRIDPAVARRMRADASTLDLSRTSTASAPRPGSGPAGSGAQGRNARWFGPDETVEVHGHTIRGGMVYVGRGLPDASGSSTDPSLINVAARIATSSPDRAGTSTDYYPSYSQISPNARLAHLQWLAGGRRDPDVGICFPFMFLYGLERRLVHERSLSEAPAILAEVERLLGVYGGNSSFGRYASSLRDAAALLWEDAPAPDPTPEIRNGYELPLHVRAHLGRLIADGKAFGPDDALMWVLGLPETRVRTVVERCMPEVRALWRTKFSAQYPSGMKVPPPRTQLRFRYQAASRTFNVEVVATHRGRPVPDLVNVTAPVKWMRETFDACVDELAAYSRLIGRKPGARGTAEAAMLLPRMILDTEGGAPMRALHARVAALVANREIATVPVPELLAAIFIEPPPGGKATAAFCNQVGSVLDLLDVGMEPDRRHGSPSLAPGGVVELFKAKDGGPVDASSDAYRAARTMVEVAALAAAADGAAGSGELLAIREDLREAPGLEPVEGTRLLAFASFAMKDGPKLGSTLSKVAKLPPEERRRVARSAMSAVLSDGHASPAEVRFLEKLHKALGLPADAIYSAIHRGTIEVDAPTVVAAAEASSGVPIPADDGDPRPTPARREAVRIDMSRLERVRAETSEVSSILAGIFEEEEPTSAAPTPPSETDAVPVAVEGLDLAHGSLLLAVADAGSMPRAGFDEVARGLGLLPDGAMETVNEWAFDRFGEPALEGEDPVEVPAHLRDELTGTRD